MRIEGAVYAFAPVAEQPSALEWAFAGDPDRWRPLDRGGQQVPDAGRSRLHARVGPAHVDGALTRRLRLLVDAGTGEGSLTIVGRLELRTSGDAATLILRGRYAHAAASRRSRSR